MSNRYNCVDALCRAGISHADAIALRRISMTLHRWHELECGDGNDHASWTIARGKKDEGGAFEYDDAGKPWLETHYNGVGLVSARVPSYRRIPDRERGALKRLAAVMARYPDFVSYVQGDPRGASLYILHPNALAGADWFSTDEAKRREWLACNYSRGIAVCQ